jgi:hypothetical protein
MRLWHVLLALLIFVVAAMWEIAVHLLPAVAAFLRANGVRGL